MLLFVAVLLTFLVQLMGSSAGSVGGNYKTLSHHSYNEMKEELKKINEKMVNDKADMMHMFEELVRRNIAEEERRAREGIERRMMEENERRRREEEERSRRERDERRRRNFDDRPSRLRASTPAQMSLKNPDLPYMCGCLL